MLCSSCGRDNQPGSRFCNSCGAQLELPCPACGRSNPPGSSFCNGCGNPLGEPNQPDPIPPQRSVVTQPTSFASGRYQVKHFLGEGGKKKVYLAHDTTLDRDVAFALIRTDGLDETSRTRIQREAQAMGRLGSHPHIVTVFDLGDHQGQPFMVTELMAA